MTLSTLLESALLEGVEIDTETSSRRVYVRNVSYGCKLNQDLRAIGAKWDANEKSLWVGVKKLPKVKDLVGVVVNFRDDMERRRKEGLGFTHPKSYDVRDLAKKLGGVWDKFGKVWLMPDRESFAKVKGEADELERKVQSQRAADAEKRRGEYAATKQSVAGPGRRAKKAGEILISRPSDGRYDTYDIGQLIVIRHGDRRL